MSSQTSSLLLLYTLALFLGLSGFLTSLLLTSATKLGTVVRLIPLSKRGSIDLDDGGFGEGVGSDKLVVGRMEGDDDDTDLSCNTFRSP